MASFTHSVSVPDLLARKQAGQSRSAITVLTCYDATTAQLLDSSTSSDGHYAIDALLVGDSLAMTVLGYPDTLSVTVDEMLHHVKAVSRGASRALIIADMPFMSYQVNADEAVRNAGRMIQEGRADCVKLEGASAMILTVIERLVSIGIPVMGHLGLTPQSIRATGGFKVQGKRASQALQLLKDARALEAAGAFAIVLEMIPQPVARYVTSQLSIPTIGIGAGNGCDGQVLVIDDVLGRYPNLSPRFVRRYAEQGKEIQTAAAQWADDVRQRRYPSLDESFSLSDDQWPVEWQPQDHSLREGSAS
jgi:3-methyl-2-oxobutanoate hydroxymethyltransferase